MIHEIFFTTQDSYHDHYRIMIQFSTCKRGKRKLLCESYGL